MVESNIPQDPILTTKAPTLFRTRFKPHRAFFWKWRGVASMVAESWPPPHGQFSKVGFFLVRVYTLTTRTSQARFQTRVGVTQACNMSDHDYSNSSRFPSKEFATEPGLDTHQRPARNGEALKIPKADTGRSRDLFQHPGASGWAA